MACFWSTSRQRLEDLNEMGRHFGFQLSNVSSTIVRRASGMFSSTFSVDGAGAVPPPPPLPPVRRPETAATAALPAPALPPAAVPSGCSSGNCTYPTKPPNPTIVDVNMRTANKTQGRAIPMSCNKALYKRETYLEKVMRAVCRLNTIVQRNEKMLDPSIILFNINNPMKNQTLLCARLASNRLNKPCTIQ